MTKGEQMMAAIATEQKLHAECYQPLFALLHGEHGKTLLVSEMDDVRRAVAKVNDNIAAYERKNNGGEQLLSEHPVIRTHSGQYVNVFDPNPETINIEDIAHALAHQCRFGGHLPRFYSVAQHSVLASHLTPPDEALSALLHDASEAYLLDLPRPIKKRMPEYRSVEDKLMAVIAEKFGFQWPMSEAVKRADEDMLHLEWEALMLGRKTYADMKEWSAEDAKKQFLNRYYDLTRKE